MFKIGGHLADVPFATLALYCDDKPVVLAERVEVAHDDLLEQISLRDSFALRAVGGPAQPVIVGLYAVKTVEGAFEMRLMSGGWVREQAIAKVRLYEPLPDKWLFATTRGSFFGAEVVPGDGGVPDSRVLTTALSGVFGTQRSGADRGAIRRSFRSSRTPLEGIARDNLICRLRRSAFAPASTQQVFGTESDFLRVCFPPPDAPSIFDIPDPNPPVIGVSPETATARAAMKDYAAQMAGNYPAAGPNVSGPLNLLHLRETDLSNLQRTLPGDQRNPSALATLEHALAVAEHIREYFDDLQDLINNKFDLQHSVIDEANEYLSITDIAGETIEPPDPGSVALATMANIAVMPGLPNPVMAAISVVLTITAIATAFDVEEIEQETRGPTPADLAVSVAAYLERLRRGSLSDLRANEHLRNAILQNAHAVQAWYDREMAFPNETSAVLEVMAQAFKRQVWMTLLPLACVIRVHREALRINDDAIYDPGDSWEMQRQKREAKRQEVERTEIASKPQTLWVSEQEHTWINRSRTGAKYYTYDFARLELRHADLPLQAWQILTGTAPGQFGLSRRQIALELGIRQV